MRVILIVITMIAIISAAAWVLIRLGVMIFNIMAIYRSRQHPELRNQKHGIVYNMKKDRLEADQSFIVPL